MARTYILRADVVSSFSDTTFVFVSFRRGPWLNRSSECMRPGSHTQLANNCMYPLVSWSFYFVPWEVSPFPSILYHCYFFFCMESTLYVFLPDGVFLLCDDGLGSAFTLCENSTNQLIKIQYRVADTFNIPTSYQ